MWPDLHCLVFCFINNLISWFVDLKSKKQKKVFEGSLIEVTNKRLTWHLIILSTSRDSIVSGIISGVYMGVYVCKWVGMHVGNSLKQYYKHKIKSIFTKRFKISQVQILGISCYYLWFSIFLFLFFCSPSSWQETFIIIFWNILHFTKSC